MGSQNFMCLLRQFLLLASIASSSSPSYFGLLSSMSSRNTGLEKACNSLVASIFFVPLEVDTMTAVKQPCTIWWRIRALLLLYKYHHVIEWTGYLQTARTASYRVHYVHVTSVTVIDAHLTYRYTLYCYELSAQNKQRCCRQPRRNVRQLNVLLVFARASLRAPS